MRNFSELIRYNDINETVMAKFTLHNEHGDFMHDTARTLNSAKKKCDEATYKCRVMETYKAPSPFDKSKITEHGREVYKNF